VVGSSALAQATNQQQTLFTKKTKTITMIIHPRMIGINGISQIIAVIIMMWVLDLKMKKM
jgi:hypothetical protein